MFCQKVLSCRNLPQCAFIWGYFWAILNPIRINRRSHPTFTDLRKGPTICAFAVKCLQIGCVWTILDPIHIDLRSNVSSTVLRKGHSCRYLLAYIYVLACWVCLI